MHQYEKSTTGGQTQGARIIEKDINMKEVRFTCVANVPGKEYEILAVGSDGNITSNAPVKKGRNNSNYEINTLLNQLVITPNAKSVIAGVGDPEKPGAIQVYQRSEDKPLEKLNEIQAHAHPIEKLRLSDDSQNLFSVGRDGMLCIFEVRDRDPRSAKKAGQGLVFSEEILTDSQTMDNNRQEY